MRRGLTVPVLETDHEGRDWSADPVGYVREVLHVEPWEKQRQILEAVRDHRRVAVRSCHHSGKTYCAAAIVHWFTRNFDPSLVITTAPTDRQVKKLLWYEVAQHHRRGHLAGSINTTDLEVSPTQRAYGFTTNEPERFQGWHSPNILVIVDEASGVPEEIYESIEGILTSRNARLLLIGNPNSPAGTFYNAFRSPLYQKFHISAYDVPETLLPPEWAEERAQEWGEESPVYQVRVLGEFPDQSEDSLFSMRWITQAFSRWEQEKEAGVRGEGEVVIGFDVARQGADSCVATVRQGDRVLLSQTWRGQDTMHSTGRVASLAKGVGAARIYVDEAGMGYGVLDRLREQGFPVEGVNVGEAAFDSEHYANKRAEILFDLAERFKTGQISVPEDSTLLAHLTSLRYTYTSTAKLKVESKEDMKKRGLPSPDAADSLALAFYTPRSGYLPLAITGPERPAGGFRWQT